MKKAVQNIFDFYDRYAETLITKRLHSIDGYQIKARALLILWTCTTTVMWFYVIYCLYAFPVNSPVAWGGLTFTIIHTASPWIFKFSQSFLMAGLNISLSGLGFQTLVCIYTGGVYSPAAIWLTFHPVILGFFGGTAWIFFSVTLNCLIIVCMYTAGLLNVLPPNQLQPLLKDGMILTSYIGLDVLVAIYTVMAFKINLKKKQELNHSKDLTENLVRILCHDIKNPLSVIQISSNYLNRPQENTAKWVERIVIASNDIRQIADSVTLWISHRDGKVTMLQEPISIKDMIEHLDMAFEDKLREKNILLRLNMLCQNHCILGDKSAVYYQVLNNLVSNAIKFSYENSTIDVNFKATESHVMIEVRDYGTGIHEELIEKVFSPFSVVSCPGTHNERGTGFGLSIVATIIEKLEGRIMIENMKKIPHQKGTRVEVTFPKHS
ncbi:sensor histidine kinase [Peredibacter starrii]|uniref:histidine kinase n=1 Tax=Peredibacter starrii TaxID=28202 RepID=A0AAX4HTA4_9BACT|nr:HAMP domain-containing sensor histidine kinase [Peredibacter starrii]WPU66539.1 HAMP domain-containing sensor histidine kinase [Peredibacter starrii]